MSRPFIKNLFIKVALKMFIIFASFAVLGTLLGQFLDNYVGIKPFGSIVVLVLMNIPAWYLILRIRSDSIAIIKKDKEENDVSDSK